MEWWTASLEAFWMSCLIWIQVTVHVCLFCEIDSLLWNSCDFRWLGKRKIFIFLNVLKKKKIQFWKLRCFFWLLQLLVHLPVLGLLDRFSSVSYFSSPLSLSHSPPFTCTQIHMWSLAHRIVLSIWTSVVIIHFYPYTVCLKLFSIFFRHFWLYWTILFNVGFATLLERSWAWRGGICGKLWGGIWGRIWWRNYS